MTKKILIVLALISIMVLVGCSEEQIEEEKDYGLEIYEIEEPQIRKIYAVYLDWEFTGEFENYTKRERQLATFFYMHGWKESLCRYNEEQCGTYTLYAKIEDTTNGLVWEKYYYKASDFTGEDECWNISNTEYCFIKYSKG